MSGKRFRVAFSFTGEKRDFVAKVAAILAKRFDEEAILYDEYHTAEFSRSDLAFYLSDLYHNHADLIVVVLCPDYDTREWCGLEWNAIFGLIKERKACEVMLTRFEHVEGKGLHGLAGYTDLDGKTHETAAALILQRLALNQGLSKDYYTAATVDVQEPLAAPVIQRDRPDCSSAGARPALDMTPIEIIINGNFASFTEEKQNRLLEGIKAFLKVTSDIRVVSKVSGSVKLRLEGLTSEESERLQRAIKSFDLAEFGAVDARQVAVHADVFVSYSDPDRQWVQTKLLPQLEGAGLKVLIDFRDFTAGKEMLVSQQQALANSRHTLLVMSPSWVETQWATMEELLLVPERRLLPVMLEKCQPPAQLAELSYLDFTDPIRWPESMASLLEQLGKSREIITEVATQPARRGLAALVELIHTPAVREVVVQIEDALRSMSEQVAVLRQYMELHDLFHQMEMCYELLAQANERLSIDQTEWKHLYFVMLRLEENSRDLKALLSIASIHPTETLWIGSLDRLQQELQEAISTRDLKQLGKATELLGCVTVSEPTKLMNRILVIAERLPFPGLINALTAVTASLIKTTLDAEAAVWLEELKKGIEALTDLTQTLDADVTNLASLQRIHDYHHFLDVSLPVGLDEVADAWACIHPRMQAFREGRGEWLERLQAVTAKLDEAFAQSGPSANKAQDVQRVSRLLYEFESITSNGIFKINRDLLTSCEQVLKVGETLDRGLRRMPTT